MLVLPVLTAEGAQVKGTVVLPPIHEDGDPRPEARPPLGAWRLENGRLRIALLADVQREVVVALEPTRPVQQDPQPLVLEARRGGLLEPRLSLATLGVPVTWRNRDAVARSVTLEDGDTLLPPEPSPPGGTREVRFSIVGEYVFVDPDHPFARATVVVLATPFATRTDDRGGFSLEVPDGRYRLRALWRGRWTEAQTLEVAGKGREVKVRLPAPPPPLAPSSPALPPSPSSVSPAPAAASREKTE